MTRSASSDHDRALALPSELAAAHAEIERLRGRLADAADTPFRRLVDSLQVGVYIHRDWRLLYVNEAFALILGYPSAADLMAVKTMDVFVAPHEHERLRAFRRARAAGEPAPARYRFDCVRTDGSLITFANAPTRIEWNGHPAIMGSVLDVTERKAVEDALRESESRYRDLVDLTSDWTWELDDRFHLTYFSPQFENQGLGTRAELIGRHAQDVYQRMRLRFAGSEEEREAYLDRLRNQQPFDAVTYRQDRPDAEVQYFEMIGRPVLDAQDRFVGYRGIGINTTEKRRAQAALDDYRNHLEKLVDQRTTQLNEANADLVRKERLATIGQITGTVAHELRNPLGTLVTTFEVMKRQLDLDTPRTKRGVERMERNLARCSRIIDELLDFTRSRALSVAPIEIDTWLADVLHDEPVPDGIKVLTSFTSGSVIEADTERLKQVVSNIVQNACQSMSESLSHRRELRVSTAREGTWVLIRFADSGPGIPRDALEKIFEPLFSTRIYGIGLGLPLVKRIVDEHTGTIEVTSVEGEGATFQVSLPCSDPCTNLDSAEVG